MIGKVIRAAALLASLAATAASAATTVTILTVNNPDMLRMRELSKAFTRANPDIKLDWIVVEETVMRVMRERFTADIESGDSEFDVLTLGVYEVPIWAKNGWLEPLQLGSGYSVGDLLNPIRKGLSRDGELYAAPFYGESSMLMYREDLFRDADLAMPEEPTWDQIRDFAAKLHAPADDVYGICLRGKPGWGENMAPLAAMANSFGARWFDMDWQPQFDTEPWASTLRFYVDLVGQYGPPDAITNGYTENLALFTGGHCAMWVDATVSAGTLVDPEESEVSDVVGFARAPYQVTRKGSHWLWSWALGVPASSPDAEAAMRFVAWATSRDYTRLVADKQGWAAAPPGTRVSLYENEAYRRAAPFSDEVLKAIRTADPRDSTLEPVPYVGVQIVDIPEFRRIGTIVGRQFSSALAGDISVREALGNAQEATHRIMERSGYYDSP